MCSIASIVATVGPYSLAPHICLGTVRHWFGTIKRFPAINQLRRLLSPGSPVCVDRGGELNTEPDYGNHPSALPHAAAILEKVCADVTFGRAMLFELGSAAENRGLRTSLLAVVLEPKVCIVHDLTFARAGVRTSVNNDTIFSSAPTCDLGSVLRDMLMRVLFLRLSHGTDAQIVLCRVDVEGAFWQVPVDPAGVPVFGYVAGGHVIVDFRLQFGWRNSPGFWGFGCVGARTFLHLFHVENCCSVRPRGGCRCARRSRHTAGRAGRASPERLSAGAWHWGKCRELLFCMVLRRRRHPR